LIQIFF